MWVELLKAAVRLGEGLEKNGEITPEGSERTASAIADMSGGST
jgi:exopolyphosphatase/pppGpp-phosphohydrolase